MRNITVSVTDAQYRKARVWAAERDTSVSHMVQYLLANLPKTARAVSAILQSEIADRGILPEDPALVRLVNPALKHGKKLPFFAPKSKDPKKQSPQNQPLPDKKFCAAQNH
jgi:hypothetical protein